MVGRQDRSQNGKWESGCAVSLLPPNDKACLVSLGEMSPFSVRSSTTMEQSSRVSELKNQRLHVWKILSVRDILGLFLPPSRWLCCASRSLSISILTLSLSLSLPLPLSLFQEFSLQQVSCDWFSKRLLNPSNSQKKYMNGQIQMADYIKVLRH